MSDDLGRLRRVAYGPGSSAQERARAEAALRAHELAEAPRPEVTEPEVINPDEVERSADEPDEPAEPEGQCTPGIRPVWLIPIVVAALALGALGALSATGQLSGDPTAAVPSASPTPEATDGPHATQFPIGDLEGADSWFASAQGPKDVFPHPDLLKAASIDPLNVRLLQDTDADEVTVWAAKNQDGYLCLLVTAGPEGGGATACNSRADFERGGGIGFGINGFLVSWDGRDVSVDRTAG